MQQRPLIEHALRRALCGPMRQELQQAVGWDNSSVSRFLNGDQGVTIDKIDRLVGVVGLTDIVVVETPDMLVTRKYLDAIATLCEVGVFCECARQGHGECRRPEQ